jgi:hypothetical protein
MQKDKHNIYSKEELLKLIKEGKNAPADMDEFEREALEGLKLLDKTDVLNELNAEIDSIVAKEKNRKTIYYFSAAASLVLIIGLVLFFKNEVAPDITKNEKPIASAENLKKPEGSTVSNTAPITQPETQTTYEAKEPEVPAKERSATKHEGVSSLLSQASSAPVEEKMQETKQGGKDTNNQLDTKVALTEKIINYEESKAAASPQAKQEQQEFVVSETTTANTKAANGGELDNDKSKTKEVVTTGNNAQPTQAALYKADVAANVASNKNKNDEYRDEQKNVSAGFSYAVSPDKKSNAKNYREPAFIDGDATFAAYAKQHLKISSPTKSGIIEVEFLITKTGKAEKIKILKPLDGCDACSQDVIDLIKSVKKWAPAAIDGNNSDAIKKISIQYN